MAIEENVILNVETEESQVSLKDLRKELNETKSALLNLEEGTDDYNDALKRASEIQSELTSLNRTVKNSYADTESILKTTATATAGLVAGMGALQGITNLVAGENSKAAESMNKLLSIMSVVQGVRGLSSMVTGLRNFNIMLQTTNIRTQILTTTQRIYNNVLKANPIFALVSVLAAVTAGIYALNRAMKSKNKTQEDTNEIVLHYANTLERIQELHKTQLQFEEDLLKARGVDNKEILERRIALLNEELEKHMEREKFFTGGTKGRKNWEEEYNRITDTIRNAENEIELINIRTTTAANQRREEEIQRHKEYIAELLNITSLMFAENQRLYQDEYDARQKLIDAEANLLFSASQDKLDALWDEGEAELDALLHFNDLKIQAIEDRIEYEKYLEDTLVQHKLQMANALASVLASTSDLAAKNSKEQKALASASVIISTYQAAQQSYLAAFQPIPTPASLPLGIANVAASIAMGAANLKKIWEVQVPGTSNSGSIPRVQSPQRPPVENNVNFMRQLNTTDEIMLQNQPIKAYVVESEFNNITNRTSNNENESSW